MSSEGYADYLRDRMATDAESAVGIARTRLKNIYGHCAAALADDDLIFVFGPLDRAAEASGNVVPYAAWEALDKRFERATGFRPIDPRHRKKRKRGRE